jgi:hypothetical protein
MRKQGLGSSIVKSRESFMDHAVEKLLRSSVFWLRSARLGGLPVGLIATKHRKDVCDLVTELLPLALRNSSSQTSIDTVV